MAVIDEDESFPRGGVKVSTNPRPQQAQNRFEAIGGQLGDRKPTLLLKKEKGSKKGAKGDNARQGTKGGDADGDFLSRGVGEKAPTSVKLLNFKGLAVGMKLLGAVAEINDRDLLIHLPNGLRGFVRASEASDVLHQALAPPAPGAASKAKRARPGEAASGDAAAVHDNDDDEEGGEGEGAPPPLSALFAVDQLVPCVVLALEGARGAEGRKSESRRVELSLRLELLHSSLSFSSLHVGMPLDACVKSVEDHGYVVTLGIAGVSGFLLKRDAAVPKGAGGGLVPGQLVKCVVKALDKSRSTVAVSMGGPKAQAQAQASAALLRESEGVTLGEVQPGQLVSARVAAVLTDGLLLSFLSFFSGTVDQFNLAEDMVGGEWSKKYKEKAAVKARVLYIDPASKRVGLTLRPDLVASRAPSFDAKVGDVYDDAVVKRVDPAVGLLLELPPRAASRPLTAYAHISNVADERVEKLEKKFRAGQVARVRIIAFRTMDALASVTLKESVLEQLLLSYADVAPGSLVRGTVTAVEPFGALVQLAPGIRALCPAAHLSEVQLSKVPTKVKAGAELKFRVVACDPAKKKVTLTLKKTLVNSRLAIITSPEDASEGALAHGWVTGVKEYGCFVSFYNNVTGLVHKSHLGLDAATAPDGAFREGQVVKCRVLPSSGSSSSRLALSLITSADGEAAAGVGAGAAAAAEACPPGCVVPGVVHSVGPASYAVHVTTPLGGTAAGALAFDHLCDFPGHVEAMVKLIKPGHRFPQLLVLERGGKGGLVLSAKPSLVGAADSLPSLLQQLEPQQLIPGYVANMTERGCFVRFLNRLTGYASLSQLADAAVKEPKDCFALGQSVRARVTQVSEDAGQVAVSLKQSACASTDASFLRTFFAEEHQIAELQRASSSGGGVSSSSSVRGVRVGAVVDARVHELRDYGVICQLAGGGGDGAEAPAGFVTYDHAEGGVKKGESVKARVLDVDELMGTVHLSLRKDLVAAGLPPAPADAPAQRTPKKKKGQKRKGGEEEEPATPKASDTVAAAAGEKGGKGDLELHQRVGVQVEVVKEDYLVVSLPEHGWRIGFAATRDFNVRSLLQPPHSAFNPGQRFNATVEEIPEEPKDGGGGRGQLGRLLLLLDATAGPLRPPAPPGAQQYRPGSVVTAKVLAVKPLNVVLSVGKRTRGRVHISEVSSAVEEGKSPLDALKVGQSVRAIVLGSSTTSTPPPTASSSNPGPATAGSAGGSSVGGSGGGGGAEAKHTLLELSIRGAEAAGAAREGAAGKEGPGGGQPGGGTAYTFESVRVGGTVTAYAYETRGDWAWFLLSPTLKGRLFLLESSQDPAELARFGDRFKPGHAARCRVVGKDPERRTLDLSLRHVAAAGADMAAGAEVEEEDDDDVVAAGGSPARALNIGDVVAGRVSRALPGVRGLSVQVGFQQYARAPITELADEWLEEPLLAFKEGQLVKCAVLDVASSSSSSGAAAAAGGGGAGGGGEVLVSLRRSRGGWGGERAEALAATSRVGPHVTSIKELAPGVQVQGYVKSCSAKGCFVAIAPALDARILITNLSDAFVADPVAAFPVGKLVAGRVLSVEAASGRVEMTLRSVAGGAAGEGGEEGEGGRKRKRPGDWVQLEDLREGASLRGTVKRIESFGLFVSVDHSDLVGLCHISQVSDGFLKELGVHYKVGDPVRAKVIKVDLANRKLSLTMKPSLLDDKDEDEDKEKEGEESEEEEEEGGVLTPMEQDDDDDDDEEEEEEEEEDDSPAKRGKAKKKGEEKRARASAKESKGAAAATAAAAEAAATPLDVELGEEEEGAEEEEGGGEREQGGGGGSGSARERQQQDGEKKDARNKAARAAKEAQQKEHAKQIAFETEEEFEAAVARAPGNSFVWIKYMAHCLSARKVEQARAVAERALKAVAEEEQQMNVWVAYLNLENVFGDPPKEAVLKLFNRAVTHGSPKALHLALLGIYERTKQADLGLQLLRTMLHKFKHSAKVWLRAVQSALTGGAAAAMPTSAGGGGASASSGIFQQGLVALPSHKLVKFASKAAALEYNLGSPERGRHIFESVLAKYPKRGQLWAAFIDQEVEAGNDEEVRALFERALAAGLSQKHRKAIAAKYEEFQQEGGDDEASV